MPHKEIFVVCSDPAELRRVGREFACDRSTRFFAVEAVDDLRGVVRHGAPTAILVCVGEDFHRDEVCRALWIASLAKRAVPVVVLASRYDQRDALTCFQLGVCDYLGRVEHMSRLGRVLRSVAARGERSREEAGPRMREATSSARLAARAE
ncbi:MAG: hypothetical protein AB7I30_20030 [Isosphaeraceae bacterium]